MRKLLRDNGLTLVLLVLFGVSLVGQSVAGLGHYNDEQREHGQAPLTWLEYVKGPAFASSLFENWESEFLQMALYVWLTSCLYQRGSAESRDPDAAQEPDDDPTAHRSDPDAPWPVRRGGFVLRLYQNSLSLLLILLFAVSFVLHLIGSARANCEQQALHGQVCSSVLAHAASSDFWYESFQNWQSEFLSVAVVVVFSIFLRQKGSPESKYVHAPNKATGR